MKSQDSQAQLSEGETTSGNRLKLAFVLLALPLALLVIGLGPTAVMLGPSTEGNTNAAVNAAMSATVMFFVYETLGFAALAVVANLLLVFFLRRVFVRWSMARVIGTTALGAIALGVIMPFIASPGVLAMMNPPSGFVERFGVPLWIALVTAIYFAVILLYLTIVYRVSEALRSPRKSKAHLAA